MRWTVPTPTPSLRAISLIPSPAVRSSRTRRSRSALTRGRPSLLPSARARQRPALTRSRIMALSYSANTPIMPYIARPEAVVVSSPCWCRNRPTPASCSSLSAFTRSGSERPRRVDRPRGQQVEAASHRVFEHAVELGPPVAALGAADALVGVDRHDLVSRPPGPRLQLESLVLDGLPGGGHAEVEGDPCHRLPPPVVRQVDPRPSLVRKSPAFCT